MKKYFKYKGGNVLEQLKKELHIVEVTTFAKTYYTTITNVKYEIIDYGFVKEDTNLIFVELIKVN